MDYQKEYEEYWLHPGQWETYSCKNADRIARQMEQLCGRGSVLDVGCGMGQVVHALSEKGIPANGVDIVPRIIEERGRQFPGQFHTGSILKLPFDDFSFDTVISTNCLEHINPNDLPKALWELHRVCRRFAFIQLATTPDHNRRWHRTVQDRVWWENQFFAVGFRKHPLSQVVVSYEALEHESGQLTMVFEKIPVPALESYPLKTLKNERDLHTDMLREPGRRSDAHIARYMLAREYLPKAGVVLDAACGLGYGSALLAQSAGPSVLVIGMDLSDFAVEYAQANFTPHLSNTEFQQGDVTDLSRFADSSVDLVTSFETIEHLRNPSDFLNKISRVLKPDGRFICSVPNLWVDESGKDPNPWHFHVFDFAKLAALVQPLFHLKTAYAQTAGGGMKLPNAPRLMQRVNFPVTSEDIEAEWWLAVGQPRKRTEPRTVLPHILILNQDPAHPLFSSWLADCPYPLKVVQDVGSDFIFPDDVGIFVTADTYHHPHPTLLNRAKEQGIPTLVLADGILEYRNTFEHPSLVPGSVFQPVLGHKIACLGKSQVRYLESWGNQDKCEIVGSPRMDGYFCLKRRTRTAGESFRILVMTANTPYFNEFQHETVQASLLALKRFFEANLTAGDFRLEPIWRLTKGLDKEIGVASQINDLTGVELAKVLLQVDAVITTPSTTMLEGMLLGLPVAVLDFCNVPLYVQPAWRITAESQIAAIIQEFISPPPPKMLFQETTLHDALECTTPAAPRMVQLIASMIECGTRAQNSKTAAIFPNQILSLPENLGVERENRSRLEGLFPLENIFRTSSMAGLQVELAHLRKEITRYKCNPDNETGAPSGHDSEYALLQYLDSARIISGRADQRAIWEVSVEGQTSKALLLQPPVELVFDIPTGEPGIFTTEITLHPDVWTNPEAGACEFQVQIDQRIAMVTALDPTRFNGDRCWHRIRIEVPASPQGNHKISLRTRSPNAMNSFRWALWRTPRFVWAGSSTSPNHPYDHT